MKSGKKLTEAPTNLKEAIDWVLRVSGRDASNVSEEGQKAIKGLAEELIKLFKKDDGSEVALIVLDKYRRVSESVIEGLKSHTNEKNRLTSLSSEWGFAAPYAALDRLSRGLDPFVFGSAARVNREKAEQWVSSVDKSDLEKLIGGPANGLKKFVEPISRIVQVSVASAYKSDAKWESLKANERRECAIIFVAILPLLYIGLTYLYWRCSQSKDSSEPFVSWSEQKLTDGKGLQKYMEALGYNGNLNNSITGERIVSTILDEMFSNELQTAYSAAKSDRSQNKSPSYPQFLEKLQEKANDSLSSTDTSHPLTSLYTLSYYYITNFLYIVEPTSPATPSFAGYSGTAALAGGAYGLNLGGLGTLMSALLA
ncbi:variant erythrocyte surface antigen-1 family protein [Babesia caballi]|uniref:Variant erythrocyte surface antigen-1 family protein n=1 Tax=Babesia caballi TaxID=5871 RepID=A0AAV4LQY2_BABCB|nr:variant erythrocyte surface antigen-1 family protein [Babesia caballi]